MLHAGNRLANCAKDFHDFGEAALVEADKVHFVHRQHELADAKKRTDKGVTPRLFEKSFPGIDQKYRKLGGGRARHHVARVVLVAGCVGDDEPPPRRAEIAIGDVNGDALFALRLKPVDQQRGIDIATHGAVRLGIPRQRRDIIIKNQRRIEKKPPDQRRFAVIDRAAGQHAKLIAAGRKWARRCGGSDIRFRNSLHVFSFPWNRIGRDRSDARRPVERLNCAVSCRPRRWYDRQPGNWYDRYRGKTHRRGIYQSDQTGLPS